MSEEKFTWQWLSRCLWTLVNSSSSNESGLFGVFLDSGCPTYGSHNGCRYTVVSIKAAIVFSRYLLFIVYIQLTICF